MLGLRLDTDTEAGLARVARRERRTKSDIARDAIRAYLARVEDDEALIAEVRAIAALMTEDELRELDASQDDLEAMLQDEEAALAATKAS